MQQQEREQDMTQRWLAHVRVCQIRQPLALALQRLLGRRRRRLRLHQLLLQLLAGLHHRAPLLRAQLALRRGLGVSTPQSHGLPLVASRDVAVPAWH